MSQSNQVRDTNEDASIQPKKKKTTHATSQAASTSSRAKRKASKRYSKMWDHFTKFVNEKGEQKAKCNYCNREYCDDPKINGTTNLKYHKNVCKKGHENADLKQSELVFNSGDGSLGNWKFDQESIRKSIIEMIILDELPFKLVEGKGFKRCISLACPRFRIPS